MGIARREYPPVLDKKTAKEWEGRGEMANVPRSARWTKILSKLINTPALEIGKECYEVGDEFVVVLRILTKDEVQGYAALTRGIRAKRELDETGEVEEDSGIEDPGGGDVDETNEDAEGRGAVHTEWRLLREGQARNGRKSVEMKENGQGHREMRPMVRHETRARVAKQMCVESDGGKRERVSKAVETNEQRRGRELRELRERHAQEEKQERAGGRTSPDSSDASSSTSSTDSELPPASGDEEQA